ncbi:unnamed protein product [Closterium sp. Naga37s-1]|nr:unnamed protein product [Closterium sp. Naga37s-1]
MTATTEVDARPTDAVESTATEGARPLRKFKLREVRDMCDGFSSKCPVLGEGSFGMVYRGSAELDGRAVDVAVKRLSAESQQGVDEWLVRAVRGCLQQGAPRIHPYPLLAPLAHSLPPPSHPLAPPSPHLPSPPHFHPPLSSLPHLVHRWVPGAEQAEVLILDRLRHANLTLFSSPPHLHPRPLPSPPRAHLGKRAGQEPFSWERRVSVAWQAAEALAYLHANDVIHRDFKPSNVLLDADWTAKLSDFGMCKEQEAGKSHVSTRVMGTLGYLDPDYMETGLLRQSSDVYAFGVFLLELITGKRAVSDTGQPLTSWVFPLLDQKKPEIDLLIDSALESSFDRDSALKIAVIAKFCIGEEELRPEMTAVAERLKKLVAS